MASSISLPSLLKSTFLGRSHRHRQRQLPLPPPSSPHTLRPAAKFDLSQLLGGRGLCNGEQGLTQELKRTIQPNPTQFRESSIPEPSSKPDLPEEGFDKELLGLTGGFPGGEKGLRKFLADNPPPPSPASAPNRSETGAVGGRKAEPPDLPLLLPGMIAIVKNRNSPYYMYCGIVQRITDGKAGVLFEGGNWDRLITFRLEELERREKGPPMKSPRSAALEPLLLQNDSS